MKILVTLVAAAIGIAAVAAQADELEGVIERVDLDGKTFVVAGISFHVTADTEFKDGLAGFIDLVRGLEVEIDYVVRDGRHIATGIELED